jgi:hypothetical protein
MNIEEDFIFKPDGDKIFSLSAFADFAKEEPQNALAAYTSVHFEQWLTKISPEAATLHTHIKDDEDTYRSLDNFLRMCGLKEQASLLLTTNHKTMTFHGESDIKTEEILFERLSWGRVDCLVKKPTVNWLTIDKERITDDDVEESGNARLTLSVNPKEIAGSYARTKLVFESAGETQSALITVKKLSILSVKTSKERYNNEESGYLTVENYAGQDIVVEILAKEDFVSFASEKYLVSASAEIPFRIKRGASYGKGLAGSAYETKVILRTYFNGVVYTKSTLIKF